MPAERYYYAGDLVEGTSVVLQGKEHHHLAHVMRANAGDAVELVNGRGALAQGTLRTVAKRQAELDVGDVHSEPPPQREVILAQGLARTNRLEFIFEKGTELGMTHLWLFAGDRSEKTKLSEGQLERMRLITIAAMKQCGRLYLPHIEVKPALTRWEKPAFPLYFGDLNPEAPGFTPDQDSLIFVIGPESGLSEKEEEHLRLIGAHGVKLHSNVLRTDTAALAALTLITHK